MPIQMTLKAAPEGVSVKLWTDTAQGEALDQLKNVARLPVTYSHVAAMPDVHYGHGATVGSVIATRAAIIPAAVGVDIGCGMHAVRFDLKASQLPDNLRPVREAIEARVPVGFTRHADVQQKARPRVRTLEKRVARVLERTPEVAKRRSEARRGLASGARNARRRQPLHRALPRRGGPRMADAAQWEPHARRGHRRALHPGARGKRPSTSIDGCPIVISDGWTRGLRHSIDTGKR